MSPRLVLLGGAARRSPSSLPPSPTRRSATGSQPRVRTGYQAADERQGRALRRAPGRRREGARGTRAPAAARCCCSRSSPTRRSPTRCRPRASTSPTRRAAARVLVAPAGGARPAGVRQSSATSTPTAAARSSRATASGRSSASRSRPATSPTTSSSTRRAGSATCSTAAGRPVLGQADQATNACCRRDAARSRAQRRRRGAPLHGRGRLRRLPRRRPPTARRASGIPTWRPPAAGPYAAFPRYPGLLDRAQAPFQAAGLKVPWYISRGNHDGLIQGNAPASTDLLPRDRGRLPEGLPERGVRPAVVRRASPPTSCSPRSTTRRSSAAAAGRRPERRARSRPPVSSPRPSTRR